MNITTWANSKEIARSKIEVYLNSFGWSLVDVDTAEVVYEESQYAGDLADMIDRTRNNPNAIILGTFHTYKPN